jgi:transcriptional regulator with GAF, ATPase, and Fis domain
MDFEYLDPAILDNIKKRYGIIGSSPKTNNALKQLLKAAPTELNILITGETGTGKEVFAHAVHGLSNRRKTAL